MDFSTVNSISIAGKKVIAVSIGGNQVTASIDETGNILDGCGYRNGYRVSSDGSLKTSMYGAATGFIPAKPGDKVEFAGGNWNAAQATNCIFLANSEFKRVGTFTQQPVYYGICTAENSIVTEENGVYTYTVPNDSNIKYIRLSLYTYDTNYVANHGKDLRVIASSGVLTVWRMQRYTVTLPIGLGYTVTATDGSTSPVEKGGNFSFTLSIADGYMQGDNFAVKVNGTAITAVDGVYTITNIRENKTVIVDGVVEAPTYKYTNLVPTSIDTDGSIYNGTGYRTDYRLSSDATPKDGTGGTITGFIKVKAGDVVRIATKGKIINWPISNATNCIHYFSAYNGKSIGRFMGNGTVSGVCTTENSVMTEEVYRQKYRFTVPNDASIEWVRIGIYGPNGAVGADLIVTVNEEITDVG